ncbi:hypothetical protein [Synechococcus sp. KORDI-52]|uniref:hypothetical protein n=1 Tax=Synechococcus sp. KORDI-52 TaxID=585425 RepID=UPI0012EC2927|nr:hypothetical protein [Synechococcus sp. KORDI-52]
MILPPAAGCHSGCTDSVRTGLELRGFRGARAGGPHPATGRSADRRHRSTPAPNSPSLEVMLLVPGEEEFAVIEPAACKRLHTPRGGRYIYRVMTAAPVDVRFCAF